MSKSAALEVLKGCTGSYVKLQCLPWKQGLWTLARGLAAVTYSEQAMVEAAMQESVYRYRVGLWRHSHGWRMEASHIIDLHTIYDRGASQAKAFDWPRHNAFQTLAKALEGTSHACRLGILLSAPLCTASCQLYAVFGALPRTVKKPDAASPPRNNLSLIYPYSSRFLSSWQCPIRKASQL